jgi:hypothetical protein
VDSRIATVLDAYHARMEEERETRHQADLAGLKDTLRDSFMLGKSAASNRPAPEPGLAPSRQAGSSRSTRPRVSSVSR